MNPSFFIPAFFAAIFLSACATSIPVDNELPVSENTTSSIATETGDIVSEPNDPVYMQSLKHIGLLSADDRFVWCGKDGRYSMQNGYGNQSYPLDAADPGTFKLLETDYRNGSYFQDRYFVFFAGLYEGLFCVRLSDVDMPTFEPFIGPIARDKNHVYIYGKALADIDSASLKILKKKRWPSDTDKDSFDELYLADKTSVYYWLTDSPWALYRITGADPNHFSFPSNDSMPQSLEEVKTIE